MKSEEKHFRVPQISSYSCGFTTSLSAGNTDFHIHSHNEIYLLLRGRLQYFVENKCYELHSGSMILFSESEIHKAINMEAQDFSRMVIHINSNYIRQFCTAQTNLLECFHRMPGEDNLVQLTEAEIDTLIQLGRELKALEESRQDYGNDLLCTQLLLRILVLTNRAWLRTKKESGRELLHRSAPIMAYIETHLHEELSLDLLARALSMGKYYMSHLFKAETGSTIFHYILVKRVSLAQALLRDGCTVSEACEKSGFRDYSHFIRSFTRLSGISPGQYKKQARQLLRE